MANRPIGTGLPADNWWAGELPVPMKHPMRTLPCGSPADPPVSAAAAAGLLAVSADLATLDSLLANASRRLFAAFSQASQLVSLIEEHPTGRAEPALRQALADAAVALQFEDMAQQKLANAQYRLRAIADSLPGQSTPYLGLLSHRGLAVVPQRPVEQADVHAGSVDLF